MYDLLAVCLVKMFVHAKCLNMTLFLALNWHLAKLILIELNREKRENTLNRLAVDCSAHILFTLTLVSGLFQNLRP